MSNSNYPNSMLHHQPGAAERVEVVNPIEIDFSQIELDLSEINVDLTSIETLIGVSNDKLDEVKGAIEGLELELDLTTLEGDTAAIRTAVEAMEAALDLSVLEGDTAAIRTAVEDLELSIDLSVLEGDAAAIKNAVEAMEAALDLSVLEGDTAAIRTAVEAIDLSTLEGDLAAVKGELAPLTDKALGVSVTASEAAVVEVNVGGKTTVTAWVTNTGVTNALDYKLIRYADATTDFSRVIVDWSALSANSTAIPIDIVAFPGRYVIQLRSTSGTTANVALQAGG